MSSGGSGGSDSTQTIKSGPPDYLSPYVKSATADAQKLYQAGGPAVFPGSTVTNLSPETTQGWGGTAARAIGGSPLTGAAQGWAQGILNGTSPDYGQLGQSVWSQVRPQVDSAFSGAGRYGSDAHAEALSRGYTEGLAPAFASLQSNAAGMANPLANQDYTDLQQLQGVGQQRDQYGQALVTDAYNRFNQTQQRPYDNINQYIASLYGSPWNTQQNKAPSYQPGGATSYIGTGLSALGTAAQLYSAFK